MERSVKLTVMVAGIVILLATGGMFLFRGSNAGAGDAANRAPVTTTGGAAPRGGAGTGVAAGGSTAATAPGQRPPAAGSVAGGSASGVSPDQQKYVDDELKK